MNGELEEAARAYRRAEALLNRRRRELTDAIITASKRDPEMRQTDIVHITGYTREHVRRILKSAGSA